MHLPLDHTPSLIKTRGVLGGKFNADKKAYAHQYQRNEAALKHMHTLEEDLTKLLPPDEGRAFKATIQKDHREREQTHWKESHHNDGMKMLLGFAGQPKLAFNAAYATYILIQRPNVFMLRPCLRIR